MIIKVAVSVGVDVGVSVGVEVGVRVGVSVAVGVKVGVSEGVLVRVAVTVGLAVGVLYQPPFLLLTEMMMTPRMMARMATMPIMVLDFIRFSYGIGATIVPMAGASPSAARRGRPFSISTGVQS